MKASQTAKPSVDEARGPDGTISPRLNPTSYAVMSAFGGKADMTLCRYVCL